MAIYCTRAQLGLFLGEEELAALSDRDNTGAADEARIADALVYADGVINGYVARRYSLPLAVIPRLLTELARDLAHYRLYTQAPLEHVKDAYEAALKQLQHISDGLLVLDLVDGETPTPPSRLASHGQARSQFDWERYG